jgi:hypothetical protein
VLTTQITGTEGITPYRQWGNTPLWLWVMISGGLGVMVWRRDTRKPSKISTNL